jgi:DNA-binding NarL/FixJ family response regulator
VLKYLTNYELDILYVLAIGWSYRQISMRFDTDKQTIRKYIHIIYSKLHAENSEQAVRTAIKLGYLKV